MTTIWGRATIRAKNSHKTVITILMPKIATYRVYRNKSSAFCVGIIQLHKTIDNIL